MRFPSRTGAARLAVALPAAALVLPAASAAADRVLYVVDPGGATPTVIRVDPTTGAQTVVSQAPAFLAPSSIAAGADGMLYAGDVLALTVFRVDPASGTATPLTAGGTLGSVQGIARQADGRLAVVDLPVPSGTATLLALAPATDTASTISSGGSLGSAFDVAVGPSGTLYVSETATPSVFRVDPSTGAQTLLASGGSLVTAGPIALEAGGDVLLADVGCCGAASLLRIAAATGSQSVVTSGGSLDTPWGLAVAADGTVYVADRVSGIVAVNPSTGAQSVISTGGAFVQPSDVVVVEPLVSTSASSLSFGSVAVGGTSGEQTVVVTNTGTGALDVGTVALGGAGAAAFSLATDTCSGATVAAGGTCSIGARFAPPAVGAASASVTISDDAFGSPRTISLAGTGSPAGGGGAGSSFDVAKLSLALAPAPAAPGETVTYYAHVGGEPFASGVELEVALPVGARLLWSYADRGSGCTAFGERVSCALDWVDADHPAHVTLVIRLVGEGSQTATARLSADQFPGSGSRTETTVTTPSRAPLRPASTATVRAVSPVTLGPARAGIRELRARLHVAGAERLTVRLGNLLLLRRSRVGTAVTGYWRRGIVARVARDGLLRVVLRVPSRSLARGPLPRLRVTADGPGGASTRTFPLRRGQPAEATLAVPGA